MKRSFAALLSILLWLLSLARIPPGPGRFANASRAGGAFAPEEVKCLYDFFEQTDVYGVKNGAKLMGPGYESIKLDPASWLSALPAGSLSVTQDDGGVVRFSGVSFTGVSLCGEMTLNGFGLLKAADLSQNGLSGLTVSNCPLAESVVFTSNGTGASVCKLEALPSLKTVDCSGSSCGLFIGGSPAMELVKCGGGVKSATLSDCGLAVFDACGNGSISLVQLAGSGTESLSVSGCASLEKLDCSSCALEELDLTGCFSLKDIDCSSNALESLDLTGLSDLRYLDCSDNSLIGLELNGCSSLEKLNCSENCGLTLVRGLAPCPLKEADFSFTPIRELDLTGMTELQTMSVAGCGSLVRMIAPQNKLTSLDCTGLGSLGEIDLNGCARLNSVSALGTSLKRADLRGTERVDLTILAEGEGIFEFSLPQSGDAVALARPSSDAAHLGWFGSDGALVTDDAACPIVGIPGGSLTAVFGSAYHTVTFTDGIDGETVAEMTVRHGDSLIPPELPVHEGLDPVGWLEDGVPADFTRITRDMCVTACYSAALCEVVFIDGITLRPFSTLTVAYGSSVTPPEPPVHAGWHFTGWDRELDCITEDMTVYAGYEADYDVPAIGDVNCDGFVTASDISALFAYVMNSGSLTYGALMNADLSGDGSVNATDASLLALKVFGS